MTNTSKVTKATKLWAAHAILDGECTPFTIKMSEKLHFCSLYRYVNKVRNNRVLMGSSGRPAILDLEAQEAMRAHLGENPGLPVCQLRGKFQEMARISHCRRCNMSLEDRWNDVNVPRISVRTIRRYVQKLDPTYAINSM